MIVLLPGEMFAKNIKKGFTNHIQDGFQRYTEQSGSESQKEFNPSLIPLMVIFHFYMTGFG